MDDDDGAERDGAARDGRDGGRAPARRPRADSLRNRERLIAAAGEVFSAGGPGASLEAVARHAGVGIGTLYRHFPTREALFQAVYKAEVDDLVALADALAGDPAPREALRRWLRAGVRMVTTKKGMMAALAPVFDGNSTLFSDMSARLGAAAGRLMAQAVAAGELRDDLTPDELMRAVFAIFYSQGQDGWQEKVLRLIDVFVDGMAPRKD